MHSPRSKIYTQLQTWCLAEETAAGKDRRRYAAVEAAKLGRGGKTYIAQLFGCDPDTIAAGMHDVEDLPTDAAAGRVRKKGWPQKASCEDPDWVLMLRQAVQEHTAGSPVEPGRLWTNRSPAELADELTEQGHPVDRKTVKRMLKEELQLSRRKMDKVLSMGESPDREAQSQRMRRIKQRFLKKGFPVLSIDTKKKELLGQFHRAGPAWTNGRVRAWDHDFPSSSWGKVIP